jgi:hypothetical protein
MAEQVVVPNTRPHARFLKYVRRWLTVTLGLYVI